MGGWVGLYDIMENLYKVTGYIYCEDYDCDDSDCIEETLKSAILDEYWIDLKVKKLTMASKIIDATFEYANKICSIIKKE